MSKSSPKKRVERINRRQIHKGASLNFYIDTMRLYNGKEEEWDYVEHIRNAAAVLPVLPDGRILLVSQYRPAVDRIVLEIPAGAREGGTEDPLICAKRELLEETGYTSDDFTFLMKLHTAPAYCSELIDIFLAKNVYLAGDQNLDEAEAIDVKIFSYEELTKMIKDGILQDGKTIAALGMYPF